MKTMGRIVVALAAAVMLAPSALAVGPVSNTTFVYARPKVNSFWHTAMSSTVTVPVDYPSGVSSATLTVSGPGYSATYSDISARSFTFTLPAATSPSAENVYDLALEFSDGTVRTAKLGLVQGLSAGAESAGRCVLPKDSRRWNKIVDRAVLPIPCGMTSLTVDGVATDTGLDGEQGWFALGGVNPGQSVSLLLAGGDEEFAAALLGGFAGMHFIVR